MRWFQFFLLCFSLLLSFPLSISLISLSACPFSFTPPSSFCVWRFSHQQDQRATVISLQKLIVREVAHEERGLFLITAGIANPEMVEVHASSRDERNTWMQLIQDAMHSMWVPDILSHPSPSILYIQRFIYIKCITKWLNNWRNGGVDGWCFSEERYIHKGGKAMKVYLTASCGFTEKRTMMKGSRVKRRKTRSYSKLKLKKWEVRSFLSVSLHYDTAILFYLSVYFFVPPPKKKSIYCSFL